MTYRPHGTTLTIIDGDRLTIQTDRRRATAILNVLAGSTLQEVGDLMGLSRERIRQYLKDAGIRCREVRTRFHPSSPLARDKFDKAQYHRQKTRQRRRQRERVARWVPWIAQWAKAHGRGPTYKELAQAIGVRGPSSPMLLDYFRRGRHWRRHTRLLKVIYRMAGITTIPDGRAVRFEV